MYGSLLLLSVPTSSAAGLSLLVQQLRLGAAAKTVPYQRFQRRRQRDFLWKNDAQLSRFRIPTNSLRRPLEWIHRDEIALAILSLVEDQFGVHPPACTRDLDHGGQPFPRVFAVTVWSWSELSRLSKQLSDTDIKRIRKLDKSRKAKIFFSAFNRTSE